MRVQDQAAPATARPRHSSLAAGWLIDDGWDLYAVQERSGHESIKTTFDVSATDCPRVTPIA